MERLTFKRVSLFDGEGVVYVIKHMYFILSATNKSQEEIRMSHIDIIPGKLIAGKSTLSRFILAMKMRFQKIDDDLLSLHPNLWAAIRHEVNNLYSIMESAIENSGMDPEVTFVIYKSSDDEIYTAFNDFVEVMTPLSLHKMAVAFSESIDVPVELILQTPGFEWERQMELIAEIFLEFL